MIKLHLMILKLLRHLEITLLICAIQFFRPLLITPVALLEVGASCLSWIQCWISVLGSSYPSDDIQKAQIWRQWYILKKSINWTVSTPLKEKNSQHSTPTWNTEVASNLGVILGSKKKKSFHCIILTQLCICMHTHGHTRTHLTIQGCFRN